MLIMDTVLVPSIVAEPVRYHIGSGREKTFFNTTLLMSKQLINRL